MCMKVDLPEPDGPVTETNSPASILDEHPTQRTDLHFTKRVDFRQVTY